MKEKILQKWADFREVLEVLFAALLGLGLGVLAILFAFLFNAAIVYATWNILVEWLFGGPHMDAVVAVGVGIGWGLLNLSMAQAKK